MTDPGTSYLLIVMRHSAWFEAKAALEKMLMCYYDEMEEFREVVEKVESFIEEMNKYYE